MRDPAAPALSKEEGVALAIAVAAHAALIAALTLSPPGKSIQLPPERMTVTFSDQIADRSTSPDPDAQAAPDVAPQLGEPQPEPAAQPEPAPRQIERKPQPQPHPPQPQPRPQPQPQSRPRPVQQQPRSQPAARSAPVKPAPPRPAAPKPVARPAPAPSRQATPVPVASRPADDRPRRRPDAPSGGSRIGNDFLKGVPGSQNPGTSRTPPAQTIGPQVASSLRSEISRQLKPHWTSPQGVDVEQLRTIVEWEMNADGSLAGTPRVVETLGITDSNAPQVKRHQEQALRAIRLAAPFQLPQEFYAGWKRVRFEFNRNLNR